jgi:diacylglycerol kinase (ATP)
MSTRLDSLVEEQPAAPATSPPRRPRFVVIVNPATRGNVETLLAAVRRNAPSRSDLDVHLTTGEPFSQEILGDPSDIEAVIAIGGDGTVTQVAQAIGDYNLPLGVIAAGSTNIIARNLGLPVDPDRAASLVFGDHRIQRLDVGICNDHRFLHMAGAGFDSRLFMQTNRKLKRYVGWAAYVPGAAKAIFMPPASFHVAVDDIDVRVDSTFVMVANGAGVIHPSLRVFPDIRTDDGWLDVVIFTATTPRTIGRSLARFVTQTLDRSQYVFRLRGRRVWMESDPAMPLQLDGDVIGMTPASFSVASRSLSVIAPLSK